MSPAERKCWNMPFRISNLTHGQMFKKSGKKATKDCNFLYSVKKIELDSTSFDAPTGSREDLEQTKRVDSGWKTTLFYDDPPLSRVQFARPRICNSWGAEFLSCRM